ncbi:DegV family protein [Salinicoccus sp. ID82-1]|uniref:DegV family protein n=1 Tax=Salinicoccus sp. ID82-1 TaxID=2820269 RepID=UPI001F29C525|nr:DegV family protein [Salinicoccus sp. ID82-1]MCG1010211.1 DegV family protein [Salinicoccus sp. ID82-1]
MKKIAVVTDSASGVDKDYMETHDVRVLPMSVIIDGVAYRDGIDATTEEIYSMLKESGEGAKTSQPTIGEFMEVYEALEADDNYEAIIAIHASSELTGTYQSSLSVSEDMTKPVYVIDSRIGSYPMKQMVEHAVEARNSDRSMEEVVQDIRAMRERAQLYLLPQSFNQMRKSGRISASQSMLASVLNIHLKLKFDDGKVVIGEKLRTKKKMVNAVLNRLETHVKEDAVKTLAIVHAGNADLTEEWKTRIEERMPQLDLVMEPLVTVAGVHTGHGTVGFGFTKNQ